MLLLRAAPEGDHGRMFKEEQGVGDKVANACFLKSTLEAMGLAVSELTQAMNVQSWLDSLAGRCAHHLKLAA